MTTLHHLSVQKTARYYTLSAVENPSEIWFVLHGYAELAYHFIQQFRFLENGKRLIIAPEGLNRFYAKGFGGNPTAAWMTSEDRENEIADYLAYLDTLYAATIPDWFTGKVIVLGFSQGVATGSRWIHHSANRFSAFIVCSGEIGAELQSPLSEKIKAIPVTYLTGTEDRLISKEKQDAVYTLMSSLNARIIRFTGGHEINKEALRELANHQ